MATNLKILDARWKGLVAKDKYFAAQFAETKNNPSGTQGIIYLNL